MTHETLRNVAGSRRGLREDVVYDIRDVDTARTEYVFIHDRHGNVRVSQSPKEKRLALPRALATLVENHLESLLLSFASSPASVNPPS